MVRTNIGEMLKHTENLNVLDEQATAMEAEAMDYDEAAEEIKEYFWWKDCKVTIVLFCVGIIVIVIVGFCIYSNFK